MKAFIIFFLFALSAFKQFQPISSFSVKQNIAKRRLKNLIVNAKREDIPKIFEDFSGYLDFADIIFIIPKIMGETPLTEDNFKNLLEEQLNLCEKNLGNPNNGHRNLFLIGEYLRLLRENDNYKNLDEPTKQRVEDFWYKTLQSKDKNVFKPEFCLQNVRYSTFLYTALKEDAAQLHPKIWLWYGTNAIDGTSKFAIKTTDYWGYDYGHTFKVYLTSTYFEHMGLNINAVDNEFLVHHNVTTAFAMKFVDNERIEFSAGGYLMCAGKEFEKDAFIVVGERRYPEEETPPAVCQWRLIKCLN